jgi:threonine synthase
MNSLRVEGQKSIALEIIQQFDWEVPDWVLVPGGNLGNVSAIAKGFLEAQRMGLISTPPRLVCCQAEHANPLYQAYARAQAAGRALSVDDFEPMTAKPTLASAIQIGDPVSLAKAVTAIVETNGIVMQASEEQLANASARADRTGLFTCPHTGVALACLEQLVADRTIAPDDRVVVVSTAHGLKFTEFKTGYHEQRLGFASEYANAPIAMTGDPEQAVGELHRLLDARGLS